MKKGKYIVSEGAIKVLGFLTKYQFYVGEPLEIDGNALKEFIGRA